MNGKPNHYVLENKFAILLFKRDVNCVCRHEGVANLLAAFHNVWNNVAANTEYSMSCHGQPIKVACTADWGEVQRGFS